jgi:pimeloyl-ACP methyl ester carboxylesterase
MDEQKLKSLAFVSAAYLDGQAKALFICFPGLGGMEMKSSLEGHDLKLSRKGALFVYPFVNPWNWMNQRTVDFSDLVLDAVLERQGLPANFPVVARGGSMGGYSALAFAMFSRHKIKAVIANCPVTDILFHYSERPDLPRTFHDAMGSYGDISEELEKRSPNHRPEKLPDCKYLIIHGLNDKSVNKQAHSDKLVKLMRERKLDPVFLEDKLMAHCSPMSYETLVATESFTEKLLS